MQAYVFVFLVALVTGQNDTSILDKLSYAVENTPVSDIVFQPFSGETEENLIQHNVSTIIHLETYDYNATKLLENAESKFNVSAVETLLSTDPDENIIPEEEVTQPLNFDVQTESHNLDMSTEIIEQVPLDQLRKVTSKVPEVEEVRDDSTTMIIDLDPPKTTPTSNMEAELKQEVTISTVTSENDNDNVTKSIVNSEVNMENVTRSTVNPEVDIEEVTRSEVNLEEVTKSEVNLEEVTKSIVNLEVESSTMTIDLETKPTSASETKGVSTDVPDTSTVYEALTEVPTTKAPTIQTIRPTTTVNSIPQSTPYTETETIDIPPPNVNVAAPIITLPDEPEVVGVRPATKPFAIHPLPTATVNSIPQSTPYEETETINIPPPNVNVAAPIITLPDEPEVVDVRPPMVQIPPNRVETVTRRVTVPVPVIQSTPYGSQFFVQSGNRIQAYPMPGNENERLAFIFNVMSRYRLPQLIVNQRPYVVKVPQAKIVEV